MLFKPSLIYRLVFRLWICSKLASRSQKKYRRHTHIVQEFRSHLPVHDFTENTFLVISINRLVGFGDLTLSCQCVFTGCHLQSVKPMVIRSAQTWRFSTYKSLLSKHALKKIIQQILIYIYVFIRQYNFMIFEGNLQQVYVNL